MDYRCAETSLEEAFSHNQKNTGQFKKTPVGNLSRQKNLIFKNF